MPELTEEELNALIIRQVERIEKERKPREEPKKEVIEKKPYGICLKGHPYWSEKEFEEETCKKCGERQGIIIEY